MVIEMNKSNSLLKIIFSLGFIALYVFGITKIYKTNIWVYKSYVLFVVLILIIYFMFRLLNKLIPNQIQLVAKLVSVRDDNNKAIITYQYLDEQYNYEVELLEYDQNKYFKYGLDKWYTIIVKNNKVVKLLDPSQEPIIDKKELEKKKNKKTKYGLHIYMFNVFEYLLLIGLIILPVEIVLTKVNINIVIVAAIEVVTIILFIFNSVLLSKLKHDLTI